MTLRHSIHQLLQRNRHGSYNTQANRRIDLLQAAKLLKQGGFKLQRIQNLKPKHLAYLCQHYTHLSVGTQKNKAAHLRWLCERISKPGLMPRSNSALGVAARCYVTNQDRSLTIAAEQWQQLTDQRVIIQLQLQRVFGLRKTESMKLQPHVADHQRYLELKGSWCKGGRPRCIPIRTDEQRDWLERAKTLTRYSTDSLIPNDKSLVQYMKNQYEPALKRAGIHKAHGLRHAYAQQRYHELTGWPCPVQGGPWYKHMPEEWQQRDTAARREISEELGHSRINIISTYIGGREAPKPEEH